MYDYIETDNLVYSPMTELVYTNGEGDDSLGSPRDSATCPIDDYQLEWDEIRKQVLTPEELYRETYGP